MFFSYVSFEPTVSLVCFSADGTFEAPEGTRCMNHLGCYRSLLGALGC